VKNVVIVDDHDFFANSLRYYLEANDYTVTNVFYDYGTAIDFFKLDKSSNFAIIDIFLKNELGTEILSLAKKTNPNIRTVAISSFDPKILIKKVTGVDFFVDKGNVSSRLLSILT